MFLLIYNIVIRMYGAAIRLATLWNPKARLWINGRKDIFNTLRRAMENNTRPIVWMHSSSLGEFEQAGRCWKKSVFGIRKPVS